MSAASASPIAQRLARLHAGPMMAAQPDMASDAFARQRTRMPPASDSCRNIVDLLRRTGGTEIVPGLVELVREWPLALRLPGRDLRRLAAPLDAGVGRIAPAEWCVLDAEVTEPTGGGVVAFIVGIARVRGACLETRQWLLVGPRAELTMLERLQDALDASSVLVSFNGGSYDLPLLRKRFQVTGPHAMREPATHLDLLHFARRAWREQYPDTRLATLERHVLGHVRNDDPPEAAAGTQWLAQGDPSQLMRMLVHNGQDLISIAGLFGRLCDRFGGDAPLRAAAA